MDLPLHPMFVHLPIALAVALPLASGLVIWKIDHRQASCHIWRIVVVLALVLAIGGSVAATTGESDEEAVEAFVPEAALETHEERAEVFCYLAWFVAVIAAVGLLQGSAGRIARFLATGSSVLLLVVAIGVGHAGAELVYHHGAAQAHTAGSTFGSHDIKVYSDEHDDD
jgi:uncharacterized membrane protein